MKIHVAIFLQEDGNTTECSWYWVKFPVFPIFCGVSNYGKNCGNSAEKTLANQIRDVTVWDFGYGTVRFPVDLKITVRYGTVLRFTFFYGFLRFTVVYGKP